MEKMRNAWIIFKGRKHWTLVYWLEDNIKTDLEQMCVGVESIKICKERVQWEHRDEPAGNF
jgi:hypothetical protein